MIQIAYDGGSGGSGTDDMGYGGEGDGSDTGGGQPRQRKLLGILGRGRGRITKKEPRGSFLLSKV